jgi:division protein 1
LSFVLAADDVQERLSRVALNGVPSLLDQRASKPSSNRRRKGPAFLPSEHDDLPPGVAFMTLANHTGRITALDFTEPYGTLVSAATDDSVRVWDLCSGEEVGRLRGHKGAVKTIQTDEQLCLTAGADGDIRLWDLRLVDDYEDRLAAAMEASTRFVGKAAHGESDAADAGDDEDDELPDLDTLAKGAGIRREDGEGLVEGGPCVKTLEGHSKAVSSLYYEDGCLVRL